MKYVISLNQKAVDTNGWIGKIKANHLAILEVATSFFGLSFIKKETDEHGEWYWVSNKIIVEEIPMFEISESRCKQLISDLCEVGLLERNQGLIGAKKTFLRKGPNYHLIEFDGLGQPGKILTGQDLPGKNLTASAENDGLPGNNLTAGPVKKLTANNNTNNTSNNTNTGAASQPVPPAPLPDQKYLEFNSWLAKHAPNVLKMTSPITVEEYHRLQKDFSNHKEELTDSLLAMHNTKDLNKKYVSANLTVRTWVKRRISDPKNNRGSGAGNFIGAPADQPKIKLR